MNRSNLAAARLLALLAIALPATLAAQGRDPRDPANANAKGLNAVPVSLDEQGGRGKHLATATDATGQFHFNGLPSGNWMIRIGALTGERARTTAVRAVITYGPLKSADAKNANAFKVDVTTSATDIAPGSDQGKLVAITSAGRGSISGTVTSP